MSVLVIEPLTTLAVHVKGSWDPPETYWSSNEFLPPFLTLPDL